MEKGTKAALQKKPGTQEARLSSLIFLIYTALMSISAAPETIKALVLDLDGTFLNPGALISERSLRAIKNCMKRGLKIIIATGRAIESGELFRKKIIDGMQEKGVYGKATFILKFQKLLQSCQFSAK